MSAATTATYCAGRSTNVDVGFVYRLSMGLANDLVHQPAAAGPSTIDRFMSGVLFRILSAWKPGLCGLQAQAYRTAARMTLDGILVVTDCGMAAQS